MEGGGCSNGTKTQALETLGKDNTTQKVAAEYDAGRVVVG
jgi:hypothetical protein